MTREEAMYWLDNIRSVAESIDMAIETLQADKWEWIKYVDELSATNTEKSSNCGDLISRADAIKAIRKCKFESVMPSDWYRGMEVAQDIIEDIPSAEAEPMTEEVREALMRLTMCAREECGMCKYKDECGFDFQYKISTDNMNTLSDALMRSRCEVDAKWIPVSERLPSNNDCVLVTIDDGIEFGKYEDGSWSIWVCEHWDEWDANGTIAWMPLPKPYREDGEE